MRYEEARDALLHLGFHKGWVLHEDQIVYWDNPESQPTLEQLEIAYVSFKKAKEKEAEATTAAADSARAKLLKLGLTEAEVAALLRA